MRFRRTFVTGLAAVSALTGIFLNTGAASADAGDAVSVGGGAAGLEIHVERSGRLSNNNVLFQQEVPLDLPFVVLPREGSPGTAPITAELAGYDTTGVSAHVLRATTEGKLTGRPSFAHSTASVADLNISGSNIRAVRSECTWDRTGASATTTVVDVAGNVYTPPANTRVDLPGLGYLVLNEQKTEEWDGAQVIWVKGVDVHLFRSGRSYYYTELNVAVAFASCDPLNIPGLSGLKLLGNSD